MLLIENGKVYWRLHEGNEWRHHCDLRPGANFIMTGKFVDEEQTELRLPQSAMDKIIELIHNPPEPSQKLVESFKRYRDL